MPASLDSTLKHINRETEEQASARLAERLGLNYQRLDDYPFRLEILQKVPLTVVEQRKYAIIVATPTKLRVALVHPEDAVLNDEINLLGRKLGAEVERTVVSQSSFNHLVRTYHRLLKEAEEQRQAEQARAQHQTEKNYFARIRTISDLKKEVEQLNVTEILDAIIAAAYNEQASDIHFEPGEQGITVRFRIDGVLQPIMVLPPHHQQPIISRIKLLAQVKLDQNEVSQDGRFSMTSKGINADFRVSIIPTGYGPGIVMRILRQDMRALTLQELGFSQHNLSLIEKAIRRPYGLILVTGPTGSGKSTTLYALLQQLNTPEKKILTLEDPIEYRIEGIQQSQVDPEHGYTFAEGLRGMLRQDPDIVMVGEIRDPETATIALNASLTGHLVLSTMHTNDAVTVHTRFLELGVAPFLLTGSVQLIIAQRLIRNLVPGSTPENPQYKGRTVIAEVLHPSPEFEQAVLRKVDQTSLHGIAVQGGMVPMVQDGLEKVRQGITTEQEVYRVTTV